MKFQKNTKNGDYNHNTVYSKMKLLQPFGSHTENLKTRA